MTETTVKWIVWIVGFAMIGGGVVGVLWALFSDRARGKSRCPKCWYDMAGVPGAGLQCPECGRLHASRAALGRTRRRWRWAAVAAMLSLLGYAGMLTRKAAVNGWAGAIPSSVLVMLWPVSEGEWLDQEFTAQPSTDSAFLELCDRIHDGKLADWQLHWWVGRIERFARAHRAYGFDAERVTLNKLATSRMKLEGDGSDAPSFFEALSLGSGVTFTHQDPLTIFDPPLLFPPHECSAEDLLHLLPERFQRNRGGWTGTWELDSGGVVTLSDEQRDDKLWRVAIFDCREVVRMLQKRWKSASPRAEALRTVDLMRELETLCEVTATENARDSCVVQTVGSFLIAQAPPRKLIEFERLLEAIRACPSAGNSTPQAGWQRSREMLARMETKQVEVPADAADVDDLLAAITAAGEPAPLHSDRWESAPLDRDTLDRLKGRVVPITTLLDAIVEAGKSAGAEVWWTISPLGIELSQDPGVGASTLRVYDLSDLLAKSRIEGPPLSIDDPLADLSQLLLRSVHPDKSVWNEGKGTDICFVGTTMIVWEPVQLQVRIERFLAELRGDVSEAE